MYTQVNTLHCITVFTVNLICVYTQNVRPFLNTYVVDNTSPFVVLVKSVTKENEIKCTGSILDKNYVLTLASCVPPNLKTTNITVVANLISYESPNLNSQTRQIVEVIHHPLYKPGRLAESDLALLLVLQPFDINEEVQSIALEDTGWPVDDSSPAKRSCNVIGYGDIDYLKYDTRLKTRSVDATHSDSCSCTRRNQWMNLVCLDPMADVGLCPEDDGAPLVCNEKLVAVNHMLILKKNCTEPLVRKNICGDYSVVSYFMYLCPYMNWIKKSVKTVPDPPQFCNLAPSFNCNALVIEILFLIRFL